MGIVLLRDPRVSMTELLSDHLKRDALHREPAGVGMAQYVEAYGRHDASGSACAFERP